MTMNETTRAAIERARAQWADVALNHGWYVEPFYVQAWLSSTGDVLDSVAHRNMTADVIIRTADVPFCVYCAGEIDETETECIETATLAADGELLCCYQCESVIREEYAYLVNVEMELL
jgi:hypothetical protein